MSATFPKENLSPLKDNYRLGEELGSGTNESFKNNQKIYSFQPPLFPKPTTLFYVGCDWLLTGEVPSLLS